MNKKAGNRVDVMQFQAAVYIHDFGMMFLSDDVLGKWKALSSNEKKVLHEHPLIGAELLQRIGGWQQAVNIVMHHHEREDCKGYPEGIGNDAICDGAKILAIADAAYSMTHKQAHRSFWSTITTSRIRN